MAHDVYDWSRIFDNTEGTGRIREQTIDGTRVLEGTVITKWAMVAVYSQGPECPVTTYEVILRGRIYTRTERRFRVPRALAIMARKFVLQTLDSLDRTTLFPTP